MWTWDDAKDRANQRKHRISFAKARYVFDDPFMVSRLDTEPGEERWQTIGLIDGVVIVVVHTWTELVDGDPTGRIISARKATKNEKRAYSEGAF